MYFLKSLNDESCFRDKCIPRSICRLLSLEGSFDHQNFHSTDPRHQHPCIIFPMCFHLIVNDHLPGLNVCTRGRWTKPWKSPCRYEHFGDVTDCQIFAPRKVGGVWALFDCLSCTSLWPIKFSFVSDVEERVPVETGALNCISSDSHTWFGILSLTSCLLVSVLSTFSSLRLLSSWLFMTLSNHQFCQKLHF